MTKQYRISQRHLDGWFEVEERDKPDCASVGHQWHTLTSWPLLHVTDTQPGVHPRTEDDVRRRRDVMFKCEFCGQEQRDPPQNG